MVTASDCCARCDRRVYDAEKKCALGKVWHAFCFSCVKCRKLLDVCSLCTHRGELYCGACYCTVIDCHCCNNNVCGCALTPLMPHCCDPCRGPDCGDPLCFNLCTNSSPPNNSGGKSCQRAKKTATTRTCCTKRCGCTTECCTSLHDQDCRQCQKGGVGGGGGGCGCTCNQGEKCYPPCRELKCRPCTNPCCSCCGKPRPVCCCPPTKHYRLRTTCRLKYCPPVNTCLEECQVPTLFSWTPCCCPCCCCCCTCVADKED